MTLDHETLSTWALAITAAAAAVSWALRLWLDGRQRRKDEGEEGDEP